MKRLLSLLIHNLQVYLKTLILKNFRNFKELEAHFSDHLNVFYGENAQGKTNLLEAIYFVSTGRSLRTNLLKELIREKESYFRIEAEVIRDEVPQRIQITYDGHTKGLKIDGNTYGSFHPLLGILPTVLYTPYDIQLITGSPTERRRFLNIELAQSDPLYVHHLTIYWRAMKQRNCLLRKKSLDAIESWEKQMVNSAEYITQARVEMIETLKDPLAKEAKSLSSEEHDLSLSLSAAKDYLKQLQKNRSREMELGVTLNGPHRDDIALYIDQSLARTKASEGQKKTMIAALKLAEWERLSNRIDEPALMGLTI